MEKLIALCALCLVFINPVKAQHENLETPQGIVVDTIVRTDTIVVKELITRTDIIHRTEKVVRYEESRNPGVEIPIGSSFNSQPSIKNETIINGQTQSQNNGSVVSMPVNDISFERNEISLPERTGGEYVWVPDSMQRKVENVLNGKPILSWKDRKKEEDEFDPNEKVTFRGDTIPMVLRNRNLGRYDRGLFNFLFIPKGIWQLGLTASYGEFSTSDLEVLDLISDIDFSGHIFAIRPAVSYFFKNNMSFGLRLGYTSGKASIDAFKVDIDEDMNFDLHDISYGSKSYTAALTFTQYLGIARRGRFGVFNEVELGFSGGSSDFNRPFNSVLKKTHTNTFKAALNFSPGVCVYIVDQLSFNVSLGVFGLYIQNEKQRVDDIDLGRRTTSGANFKFNIFNINFGIAINI